MVLYIVKYILYISTESFVIVMGGWRVVERGEMFGLIARIGAFEKAHNRAVSNEAATRPSE